MFFSLGSAVLTPLDSDRKTTAMLKISDEVELKKVKSRESFLVSESGCSTVSESFHSRSFSHIHCQQWIPDDSSIQRVNHRVGFKKEEKKRRKEKSTSAG